MDSDNESSTVHQTRLEVGMTCEGCAGAVKRLLTKINGVTNIEANVETKTVIVTASQYIEPAILLNQLDSWSKASGKYVKLA